MDERTSSAFIPFKKCPPIYKHTDLYIEIILVDEPLTVTVEQVHFPIIRFGYMFSSTQVNFI